MLVWHRATVWTVLVAGFSVLAGCFQTPSRLFDKGLDVSLVSGRYDCTMPNTDGTLRITLSKRYSGPSDTLYDYKFNAPYQHLDTSVRFGKLQSGQNLIQVEGRADGLVGYSIVSVDAPTYFSMWIPSADAGTRAQRFGLSLEMTGFSWSPAKLAGPREGVVAFLESFQPNDLRVAFLCRHVT